MKNLIHTIPKEWLEEEKCRQLKKVIILEYEDYVGSTKENDRSPSEDKLFSLVSEKTCHDYQSPRENKERDHDHPKDRRKNLKCHKAIKSAQNRNHSCKKYRVSIIALVHPEPQTENHQEWKRDNKTVVHISPKKTPEKISKYCPRKSQYAIREMPHEFWYMIFTMGLSDKRREKYIECCEG